MRRGLSLALLFLFPITAQAEFFVGPGATGSSFLKVPTMARAAAMGGAFTAAQGDVNALEYNPAGLSGLLRTDITASYIDYFEDTSLQSISVGFPWQVSDRKPGEEYSSQGKVLMGLQYRLFQAKDTARNTVGVDVGNFNLRDQLLHVGLAVSPTDRLSIGLAGKYLNHKLEDESAGNYAVDAGVSYWVSGPWLAGLAVQNFGPETKFVSEGDPLPSTVRAGVGYRANRYLVLADVAYGRDKIAQKALGAEWEVSPYVLLRGGTFHHTSLEFSGGLGIRFTGPSKTALGAPGEKSRLGERQGSATVDLGLDYALRTNRDLGVTHTVSLKILY